MTISCQGAVTLWSVMENGAVPKPSRYGSVIVALSTAVPAGGSVDDANRSSERAR